MRQKQIWLAMRGILAVLAIALMLPAGAVAASKYRVLHYFTGSAGGRYPYADLIFDEAGNLYGTSEFGGPFSKRCGRRVGCGVVFKLAPNSDGSWTETVLHYFAGGTDGWGPRPGLILDQAGNLYGATGAGGNLNDCSPDGCGTVFKLAPNSDGSWTESVLYDFTGGPDGSEPFAGLIFDGVGNLYGTTASAGLFDENCTSLGCGVVFKLTPTSNGAWTESVLYSFKGGADGQEPLSSVVFDASGKLYGTTFYGGDLNCGAKFGCGVVFKLTPNVDGSWSETVLHRFAWSRDGATPYAGVIVDQAGDLYGTTPIGGNPGDGVVFRLAPDSDGKWRESLIHRFNGKGGADPFAGLIFDSAGNLYGTTVGGGKPCAGSSGCGVVFKLTPNQDGSWAESVLHVFGSKAANPYGGLVLDKAGNLYGTTGNCTSGCGGVVFEIAP